MRVILGILIPLISIVVFFQIRAGQRRESELRDEAEKQKAEDVQQAD